MAKRFFASNGINFVEKDVSSNEELRKELIEVSGALSVPVVIIDDEVFIGWDEGKIKNKLGVK